MWYIFNRIYAPRLHYLWLHPRGNLSTYQYLAPLSPFATIYRRYWGFDSVLNKKCRCL